MHCNQTQWNTFVFYLTRMKSQDPEHAAVAYLLATDETLDKHPLDVFDFQNDVILPGALKRGWQTHGSLRTTRLLFNLWNGYTGKDCDVLSIFAGCSLNKYYYDAIELRFELAKLPDFASKGAEVRQ